jgi:serine/threonine-protein kinase
LARWVFYPRSPEQIAGGPAVDVAPQPRNDRGVAGQATCGSGAAACIAVDQALAFVDGELGAAERAGVERRIDACGACRAVVAEVARGAGAELVRDAHGQTSVVYVLAATAQLRPPRAAQVPAPAPPPAPDTALVPGEVVGRYVVERPLGAGGMGVVSLARDPELRRPVVIKLVHPNMGHGEGGDELEARLRREAQAMAQVSHANVVQIFDIGRRGDRVFLAMEFVDGLTLGDWLRERPRTPEEILAVFRQAGAGLAAAHRAGLVHRDFKPGNVLVGRDGIVKVTDFGLARSVVGTGRGAAVTRQLRVAELAAPRPSGVHAVLTQANAVVGTPAYMAPEQAAGAPIDARTDQYALAVTLLDALIGQPPTRRRVAPGDPAAVDDGLARAGIAPPVRAAIVRGLAEDPAARFPRIDDLLDALVHAPAPPPRRRSRRVLPIGAGVALCGAALAAWLAFGRAPGPACTSEVVRRWTGAPRAGVVKALSASPRPFAGWEAEHVAVAIDRAVDALGAAETARCRGAPSVASGAAPGAAPDCVARRSQALASALAALAASPPSEDPWGLVRPIEGCDAPASSARAALRGKLRGASAVQAIELAGAAQQLGDALLAADALEVAGLAALAAGDARLAADQLRAMSAAGVQADSGAVQGRALLHLIEVFRATGEYEAAHPQLVALDALLKRYHEAAGDVVTAARVEGEAFTDLGDVATAFAAWDRARTAADSLGSPDAVLAAAIGRAWSTHVLRWDLAGARAAATAAIAAGAAASPATRAHALGIAAELALAAGDGAAARALLDQAAGLAAPGTADRLRALRARALLGDTDGALAELVPAASDDATTAIRTAIARGEALLAADHVSEAADVLDKALSDSSSDRQHPALPIAERIAAAFAACEARRAATGTCKTDRIAALIGSLHPRAPVRAQLALVEAAIAPPESRSAAGQLPRALEILVEAGAEPIRIAELRWQLAQLCMPGADCRGLANQAREVFQAAGRTAEVTAIDRWRIDAPPAPSWSAHDAGVPDAAPPVRREPRGPQP